MGYPAGPTGVHFVQELVKFEGNDRIFPIIGTHNRTHHGNRIIRTQWLDCLDHMSPLPVVTPLKAEEHENEKLPSCL